MTLTLPPTVRFDVAGPVAFMRIDRPTSMNALSADVRQALADAVEAFQKDDALLVGVLTGEGGRAFSAGIDLREVSEDIADGGRPTIVPQPSGLSTPFRELYACNKPLVAAIDGYCLAGGLELALMCDLRVATRQSTFGMPEPRRSLMGGSALLHLRRVMPLGEALRIHLTGAPISADRAYAVGLVQELAEDREAMFSCVAEIAGEIAQCAPLAVQSIKKVLRAGSEHTPEETWRMSCDLQEQLIRTDDFREGVTAFAEKRQPVWRSS